MGNLLTYKDFIVGRTYKVVRPPDSWIKCYPYDNLNKQGKCLWINEYGVCLMLDGNNQRLLDISCLEEVSEDTNTENKIMILDSKTVKAGEKYLVCKVPHFIEKLGDSCKYPVLNKVGKVLVGYENGAILLFSENRQHFIPYPCLQKVVEKEIPDSELIEKMKINPEGVLKIIKGLAKMNKDVHLRLFLELGVVHKR